MTYVMKTEWQAVLLPHNTDKMKEVLRPFLEQFPQWRVREFSAFGRTGITLQPIQGTDSINLMGGYYLVWDEAGDYQLLEVGDFQNRFTKTVSQDRMWDTNEVDFSAESDESGEEFSLFVAAELDENPRDFYFALSSENAIELRDALVARFPDLSEVTASDNVLQPETDLDALADRIVQRLAEVIPGIISPMLKLPPVIFTPEQAQELAERFDPNRNHYVFDAGPHPEVNWGTHPANTDPDFPEKNDL